MDERINAELIAQTDQGWAALCDNIRRDREGYYPMLALLETLTLRPASIRHVPENVLLHIVSMAGLAYAHAFQMIENHDAMEDDT